MLFSFVLRVTFVRFHHSVRLGVIRYADKHTVNIIKLTSQNGAESLHLYGLTNLVEELLRSPCYISYTSHRPMISHQRVPS